MTHERQLDDGRIERRNPRTGQTRIISREDAVRTRLTRERDAEFSMQAGAPPIAKGPPSTLDRADAGMAKAGNRAPGRARLELPDASSFADTFTKKDPISVGTVSQAAQIGTPSPTAATRAQGGPVATSPAAPAGTVASTTPAAPSRPVPVLPPVGITAAAGPNISTAPTGLPQGSIGMQRADGSYMVETAPGQSQSFANEAAARDFYATPQAAPAPALATPPPVGQPSATAATETAKQQKGATAPASPAADSQLAPAFTIKGIGQRVGQGVADLATDQTASNPANFLETAERYGAAGIGAAWDGNWNVPEKGLIRQGVEAVQGRNPAVLAAGYIIGGITAEQQRKAAQAAGLRPDDAALRRADEMARRIRTGEAAATPVSRVPNEPAPIGVAPLRPPVMPDAAGVDMVRSGGVGREPIMPALPPLSEPTPVSYVGPAPRIDMTPRPAPTPTNGTQANPVQMSSLSDTLNAIATAPDRRPGGAVRRDLASLDQALSVSPGTGATLRARREESAAKTRGENHLRQVCDRARSLVLPDLDAGSVADPEPFDFPGLRSRGLTRPSARLAWA